MCIGGEEATYAAFPFSGAAMDQPVRTMECFGLLRSEYAKVVREQLDRMKGGRGHGKR